MKLVYEYIAKGPVITDIADILHIPGVQLLKEWWVQRRDVFKWRRAQPIIHRKEEA